MQKYRLSLLVLLGLTSLTTYAAAPLNIDPYLQRADKLYAQMTLDEKIGQLLQPSYQLLASSVPQPQGQAPAYLCNQALNSQTSDKEIIQACGLDQIARYHLGSVLQSGGPNYNFPTLKNWQNFNKLAVSVHKMNAHDPLLLIGNDAVHGNTHVAGAVVFPQNINLGVTHNPELVETIGRLVANDSLLSGFNWVFMPTVAVAQDTRWGRSYESFSQDPAQVKQLAYAYITGFQQIHGNKITGVLATVKHFIGDGATQYGLDKGNAVYTGSEHDFWLQNGQGYEGAIDAGALSLMVSYSAINQNQMHLGGEWDILNQFKHQGIIGSDNNLYQFKGFSVSDYNGPTRAAYFYNRQHSDKPLTDLAQMYAATINAGVDMIMQGQADTQNSFDPALPYNYSSVGQAIDALKQAYNEKLISDARLQEAVTHILAVKLAMASRVHIPSYNAVQNAERKAALVAAEESLVLLKNDKQILPLNPASIQYIVLLGEADDIGVQNGGWTINWQGQKGNAYYDGAYKTSSGASTLADALQQRFGANTQIVHANDVASVTAALSSTNTLVISVVAEPPYAEYMGDIGNPAQADNWYKKGIQSGKNRYMPAVQSQDLSLRWDDNDANLIQELRHKNIAVITVVYSGRPVVLTEGGTKAPLPNSDVVIAAFLPGTTGGTALVNAMTGSYRFGQNGISNKLSFPWPRNMDDIRDQFKTGALYPIGMGLNT